MKIDRENGFAYIDGRQFSICNFCENEKSMTYDLSNCVCEVCGSDNGFDEFKKLDGEKLNCIDCKFEVYNLKSCDRKTKLYYCLFKKVN